MRLQCIVNLAVAIDDAHSAQTRDSPGDCLLDDEGADKGRKQNNNKVAADQRVPDMVETIKTEMSQLVELLETRNVNKYHKNIEKRILQLAKAVSTEYGDEQDTTGKKNQNDDNFGRLRNLLVCTTSNKEEMEGVVRSKQDLSQCYHIGILTE